MKAKTLRIAKTLERFLGIPKQKRTLPPPIDMLIATILSQNTNDRNSHRAYRALRSLFPRWEDVARASVRKIAGTIRVGGMANQKAARIKHTLLAVKNRYGTYSLAALKRKNTDEIIEELTDLKGVGIKTASCVLLFSLGRDVFPVDTHIHRICNRLGLVTGSSTPDKTFEAMKHLVPSGRGYSFHTNLIRFGRMICTASRPRCDRCPVFDECEFEGKMHARTTRTHAVSTRTYDFMLLDHV